MLLSPEGDAFGYIVSRYQKDNHGSALDRFWPRITNRKLWRFLLQDASRKLTQVGRQELVFLAIREPDKHCGERVAVFGIKDSLPLLAPGFPVNLDSCQLYPCHFSAILRAINGVYRSEVALLIPNGLYESETLFEETGYSARYNQTIT